MYKDGQLTISKWYEGMVKHPITGFGLLQNTEVFENKGIVRSKTGLAITNKLATGIPIAEVKDASGNLYHATNNGLVYKNSTNQIISGLGTIYDIKIYLNYLWVRYETGGTSNLGAYGPLTSGSAQWFAGISTGFTTQVAGVLVVGQDDYLYSTNGNYIAKIDVNSSGTVGVAPTIAGANTSLTALDLKDGEVATTLCEFGTKLMVGTNSGKVYPWNRQAGTLGNPGIADLPIDFNESTIYQLFSHANKLYVTAGGNGNIYISDGTNYRKLATIPFNEQFTTGGGQIAFISPRVSYYPNAIATSEQGTLLVGNVSTNGVAEAGVWEILDSGEVVLAYTLSTGKSSSSNIGVGYIRVQGEDIFVGWYKGSTYGIDEDTLSSPTFYIESPLIRVGKFNFKKSFQHIEFSLASPMTSGSTITLSYRKNRYEDYTEIGTWDFATYGAITSFEDTAGIADCEFIQIKIEAEKLELIDITLR